MKRSEGGARSLLVCLLVLLATLTVPLVRGGYEDVIPNKTVVKYRLGITALDIAVLSAPAGVMENVEASSTAPLDRYAFINVHQNENTSIVAAKAFIYFFGGSLTYIEHGATRLVSFQLARGGTMYTFDPNRMFTPFGIKKTLEENGPYSPQAAEAVAKFAALLLQVYKFDERKLVVALHNNSPNYSAASYLPGGPFHQDAAAVYINPSSDPRNFFYVTPTYAFDYLKSQLLNVVLQSNSSVTDDGSLSVYAAQQGKHYINCEAAAEGGGEGTQVIAQLNLLTKMKGLFPI